MNNSPVPPPSGEPVKPPFLSFEPVIEPPVDAAFDTAEPIAAEPTAVKPPASEPVLPPPSGAPVAVPPPTFVFEQPVAYPVAAPEPLLPEQPVTYPFATQQPLFSPQPGGYPAAAPADVPPTRPGAFPVVAPEPFAPAPLAPHSHAKKRSKKPLVISLSAVLTVALVIAGVLVFQEVSRSNAYNEAMTWFEQGAYAQALDAFTELGEYQDAQSMASKSEIWLAFEDARARFDEGAYLEARGMFALLPSNEIPDRDEWIDACDYALAEQLFAEGDFEGAYGAFMLITNYRDAAARADESLYAWADEYHLQGDLENAYASFSLLGDYSDAAARAASCLLPFPDTGVLYQNDDYYYEQAAIEIDYRYTEGGSYFKIYSGSTLVGSLFLNANTTARIYLAPGVYHIKEGTGEHWFGETQAFGTKGQYTSMVFDDTGTEDMLLEDTQLVTITINIDSPGNISDRNEDFSSF